MPNELQQFFATATQKAADDLIKAVESLPEEKRGWQPFDKARSALDQAAECAILTGTTAQVVETRAWPTNFNMDEFARAKVELGKDWNKLTSLLQENTARLIAAIQAVPDADLNDLIDTPFRPLTLAQIMSYPYWNMSYHEGQTNYINSLL